MVVNLGDLILGLKIDNSALKKIKSELSSVEKQASNIKLGVNTSAATKSASEVKTLKEEVTKLSSASSKLKIENQALKKSFSAVATSVSKTGASQAKLIKSTKAQAKSTSALDESLNKTAKTLQLVQGPLGGVAARFVTLKTIVKDNTLGVAAFTVGIAALSITLSKAFKSFVQTEATLVKFDNTIRATGRNFETTLEDMDGAAERLARRTLLSLGEARDGLGQALTFTNIPTDQIERFGNIAADVAAGLNKDFKGTVTSIAKALQAPASALDGLGRAGQFFSKGQRQVLQSLVDSGNAAKSTELILSTLEARFKGIGTAKGISGALDSLEIDLQLFRESIFTTSNAAESVATVIDKMGAALRSITGEFSLASKLGQELSKVAILLGDAFDFVSNNIESFKTGIKFLGQAIVAARISSILAPLAAINISLKAVTTSSKSAAAAMVLFKNAAKFLIGGAILIAVQKLNDKIFGLQEGVSSLGNLWITLKSVFSVVIRRLTLGATLLRDSFVGVFNDISHVINNVFSGFSRYIKANFDITLKDLVAFGADFINLGADIFKSFGIAVRTYIGSVVQSIKELFSSIIQLGSTIGDVFSGNFEEAAVKAREALKGIAENNPYSAIKKGAVEAADAVGAAFGKDKLIDTNTLTDRLTKGSARIVSAVIEPFEAGFSAVGQRFKDFNAEVEAERDKSVKIMAERTSKASQIATPLDETSKKLKDIIDRAKQLTFAQGVDEAENLNNVINGLKESLKILEDNSSSPVALKLLEAAGLDAKTAVASLKGEIGSLEEQLVEVERRDFVKAFGIGSATKSVEALNIKMAKFREILEKATSKKVVNIEEIRIAKAAIKDLEKQAFDLANPLVASLNEGIEAISPEVSKGLAGKLFGDDFDFKDIAQKFVKGILAEILQALVFDPLTKDIKAGFGRLIDAAGGTNGPTSALQASGAAPGSSGGLIQGIGNLPLNSSSQGDSAVGIIRNQESQTAVFKNMDSNIVGLKAANEGGFSTISSGLTTAFQGLKGLFSGGEGGGGLLSMLPFFGGARANGGPVSPNKSFLVGEEGPELFMPKRAGDILNAGQMGAGANSTITKQTVNFNITTPDERSFQLARGRMEGNAKRMLRNT